MEPITRVNTQIAAGDPDWWRGAVIYQIYPRSFQDVNGDGVGDLSGITARLGYVADLGVDAIWISPFFTSPMKDFGYDVSNYKDVDPLFGTISDFDHLVSEAHRLGLKVMIDQVLSHTSDHHPWFQESRASRDNARADWYVWADAKPDGSPPNNWLSIFGGSAWEWDTTRCQYYLHNFLIEQPDLNFHNIEVRRMILEQVRFWLERGVDGFRLDTVNFYFHDESLADNPPAERGAGSIAPTVNPYTYQSHLYDKSRPENLAFLKEFRHLLNTFPGSAVVGEIGDDERQLELMAAYTSGNEHIQMCYTFDFLSSNFSPAWFAERIGVFEDMVGDGWACWAFSNHDVVRHLTRWQDGGERRQFAKFCAALLLSLRGSVCLYQGEELGLNEVEVAYDELQDPYGIRFWPEFKGRDGARTPMVWQANAIHGGFTTSQKPWLPVSPAHLMQAVDQQEIDAESVLRFYRRFLKFRKKVPSLRCGDIAILEASEAVLAVKRDWDGHSVLCAFNFSAEEVTWRPNGHRIAPIEGHGLDGHLEKVGVVMPAYGAFFGEIQA